MNNIDLQYQKLLQDILDNGVEKKDRTGTGTISVFGRQIRHKMSEGFPLLTTKKMAWKTMVTELLWFLRGDTNIKYLVDNGCHIWDGDAYKNYVAKVNMQPGVPMVDFLEQKEFIEQIKTDDKFAKKWGELGPVYGKQWRSWQDDFGSNKLPLFPPNNKIDQIANLIRDLKTNPDSRRLMVNAWNVGEIDQMVLPPCHYGFQVYTRELTWEERSQLLDTTNGPWDSIAAIGTEMDRQNLPKRAISLMWNQRSVDTFLGLPFNIASYGLLLEIIAKEVNMVPDELIGNLGDVHLYSNHIEQAKEQIGRDLTLDERAKFHPNTGMFYDIHGSFSISDNIENSDLPYEDRILLHRTFDENNIPKRTREPYPLPTLKVNWGEPSIIEKPQYWKPEDFILENYQSHPAIKAPLSN
jgi:thymidylate synthase